MTLKISVLQLVNFGGSLVRRTNDVKDRLLRFRVKICQKISKIHEIIGKGHTGNVVQYQKLNLPVFHIDEGEYSKVSCIGKIFNKIIE